MNKQLSVILEWNESDNKWHLMLDDSKETFIQEFYNCGNLIAFFNNPDKTKKNYYTLNPPTQK